MKREEHPVWAVYDGLRKARLNVKYYCHLLGWAERKAHAMEIVLAVTAPTSAFTGLILFKSDVGKITWQCIAAVSGLAAVARPWMTKRIKEYEATISAYRSLESDFEAIRQKVQIRGKYDGDRQKEFLAALERARHANDAAPKTSEKRTLIRMYTSEVNSELPPDIFFIPTEQEELPKTKADVIETRARATGDGQPADEGVSEARADGAEPPRDGGKVHVRKPELRTDGPKARGGRRGAPPATDKEDGG